MAGLYIHIPFCEKRCIYCDFFSNTDRSFLPRFLKALVQEMELRDDYLKGEPLQTLYFGGGTPSQLSPADFSLLFDAIEKRFGLEQCREITVEANPDDLTADYVGALRRLPVNRISMGVQSFFDDDLIFLHRRHDRQEAVEAVKRCQNAGFENISIDLIYGLPGQTPQRWQENLQQAIALNVPHLSAYHIIYEKGTALTRMVEAGTVQPVSEDTSAELFEMLTQQLSDAGFIHYEISNFARPGYESKHNSSYWTGAKYLGLGPSAHSFDGIGRDRNVSSLPRYIEGIEKGMPATEHETLDEQAHYNETVFTGLRTRYGISLPQLRNRFGESLYAYCLKQAEPFIQEGLLTIDGDRLKLTHRAIFISDSVMCELMHV